MPKPILAVDIDGVIVLLGEEDSARRPAVRVEVIDGLMRRVSLGAGVRLRRLAEHFELVWASGWERYANEHFPSLLGLSHLPHVDFSGSARFGSADWKVGPLESFSGDRPVAWVDDNFDDACRAWASARAAPTLLVPVEPHCGLEDEHVDALTAWARSLSS